VLARGVIVNRYSSPTMTPKGMQFFVFTDRDQQNEDLDEAGKPTGEFSRFDRSSRRGTSCERWAE
jgi:hypothetical protein